MRFGRRVRELRKEHGYSQEGFAEECGLDRTYFGGIERGERNAALRNIYRIAKTLGVSAQTVRNHKAAAFAKLRQFAEKVMEFLRCD